MRKGAQNLSLNETNLGKDTSSCLQAFKALQGIVMFVMFSRFTHGSQNKLWDFIGYPGKAESTTSLCATQVCMLLF